MEIEKEELGPFEILKAPCSPEEIEWKQQTKPEKHANKWAVLVPYVDARSLMERLDKAFDCFWSEETLYMGQNKKGIDMYRCTLSIRVSDKVVISRDGWAEATDIEPVKGGSSSAFKRAGTKFGFGRDLYSYPTVYVQCVPSGNKYYPPFGYKKLLNKVSDLFLEGVLNSDHTLIIYGHSTDHKRDLKLHYVEYGKVGKEIHGGQSPVNEEPPVVKEADKKDASHYTVEEIRDGRHKPTNGRVTKEIERRVLAQWSALPNQDKKHIVMAGMAYIWIWDKDRKNRVWFVLNDYQRTNVFKP